MKRRTIALILTTAISMALGTSPAYSQQLTKPDEPLKVQPDKPVKPKPLTGEIDGTFELKKPLTAKEKVMKANMRGYVLTHEHPTVAMSFGGNYAFTGAENNYQNGIMTNGYTEACGGCFPAAGAGLVGSGCDHGEFHGGMLEWLGQVAPDMQAHFSHMGPDQKSFSHVKYSTEWVREAFNPSTPQHQDARMRIMVAYALENEVMCDLLYEANLGNEGTGSNALQPDGTMEDGWACQRGDSFDSLSRQIEAIKAWAASNSSWMQVAYSASEARNIVRSGKLAVIIGVEADYAFGAENQTFPVVQRLNDYHDMGVRTFYPAHKLNSRLTGADIYRSAEEGPGQLLRLNQAMAGCFYVDDNVSPFPLIRNPNNSNSHNYCDNDSDCGPNHFRGSGLNAGCSAKANDVSSRTIINLSKKKNKLNGFAVYPRPAGFSGTAGSTPGSIEYNNLGLSTAGRRVINAAMDRGMIITIDHMSKRARGEVREMSKARNNYPVNGFHNNPNEMLVGGTKVRSQGGNIKQTQFPNEYDFDATDIAAIKDTRGIFGVRLGPLDANDELAPANTNNSDQNMEDCPGSITENAKILAWLMEQDINVAYSLDFSTVTQGTYSATKARCNSAPSNDVFNKYKGKVTEGLSHMGMAKKIHEELERVDFNTTYLNRLKNDGVEQFLDMWHQSEISAGLVKR